MATPSPYTIFCKHGVLNPMFPIGLFLFIASRVFLSHQATTFVSALIFPFLFTFRYSDGNNPNLALNIREK
jgi:hypothetical protein